MLDCEPCQGTAEAEIFVAAMTDLNGRDAGYSTSLPADGWADVTSDYNILSPWGAFKVWKRSASGSVTLPTTTKSGIVTFFVKGADPGDVSISGISYEKAIASNGAAFNID